MSNTQMTLAIIYFNAEKTLKRCVESALSQTYSNIEILLVDDGSTDSSASIGKEYSFKNNNIKYVRKENSGLADSLNVAVSKASGSLISFLDSDDWIDPNMCEDMILQMAKDNSDICVCGYYQVYGNTIVNTSKGIKKMLLPGDKALHYLFDFRYGNYNWNKLYKKSLFSGIKYPKGKYFEDMYTSYKLFLKANKVSFLDKSYYYYVQRSGSITLSANINGMYDEINALVKLANNKNVSFNKRTLATLFLNCAIKHGSRTYENLKDREEARHFTNNIIDKYCPSPMLSAKQKFKVWIFKNFPLMFKVRYKFSDSASQLYGKIKAIIK